MHLGVSGHFNVEVVARLGADEGHQIARVVELTTHAVTAGQVAAQGHQALHAHRFQRGQLFAHAGLGGADARKM